VQLRFSIVRSSLPEYCKTKLLAMSDQRLNKDGELVLKAQEFRTQEKNREAAIERLVEIIRAALVVNKRRIATKPSRSSQRKRLDSKTQHSAIKAGRGRVDW
jgi:ribosome-associated protein